MMRLDKLQISVFIGVKVVNGFVVHPEWRVVADLSVQIDLLQVMPVEAKAGEFKIH